MNAPHFVECEGILYYLNFDEILIGEQDGGGR